MDHPFIERGKEKWKKAKEIFRQWIDSRKASSKEHVLLYWTGERLIGLQVRNNAAVLRKEAPLAADNSEEIQHAASALLEEGLSRAHAVLILNSSDLRYTVRHYPDMTRAELEETFYWDEDRAFSIKEPLHLAARPLRHSPEGWTAELSGIRKETFSLWKESLEEGGFSIEKIVPLIGLGPDPVCLYGRKKTAFCLVKHGNERIWRVIHKENAREELSVFMKRMKDMLSLEKCSISFIPLIGCGQEDWIFWERSAKEGDENDLTIRNLYKFQEEGDALLMEAAESPLDFMSSVRREEQEKTKPLQRRRVIVLLGAVMLSIGLAQFGMTAWMLGKVRGELKELTPVMIAKKHAEINNKEAAGAVERMNKAEGSVYPWGWVFSVVSDTIPDNLLIDAMLPSDHGVMIQGRGENRDSVNAFAAGLSAAGGPARLEQSQADPETGGVHYKIEWNIEKRSET